MPAKEKAYVIKKDHFNIQEVDFEQLSQFTNNFIIEYQYGDNSYFRRSLFELDRLGLNTGVLLELDTDYNIDKVVKDFINNIKGFKINIGVWLIFRARIRDYVLLDDLSEYKNHFILGIKNEWYDQYPMNNYPQWKEYGDISTNDIIDFVFMNKPVEEVYLNTDYKTIYKENNLKPIPSNYKF